MSRSVLLLAVAAFVLAACGHVIATPPPAAQPTVQVEARVAGAPITVAAKAARVLQDFGFTTRRFSSDSTWGSLHDGQASARFRYSWPMHDSTRVLLELWGRCSPEHVCTRGDAMRFISQLSAEEAPPSE